MEEVTLVDMRSDTLSLPSPDMRRAMADAEVGENAYGEDPTINRLQVKMAEIFGKEAALFVPSGTMGNLISVMAHCYERSSEVLVGNKAHMYLYGQGSLSQVACVHPFPIRNLPDGTLDLQELEAAIRPDKHYFPKTRLICLENTHNLCGGKAVPISFHEKVRAIADKHGLKIHLDGARLMNAAVALGVKPRDVTEYCDSVCMCFSKGLGAPVGSVIAGTKDFIVRAHRLRYLLGGVMSQAGVLAAPAQVALLDAEERIRQDHQKAQKFAEVFQKYGNMRITLQDEGILTNLLVCTVSGGIDAKMFIDRLAQVTDSEVMDIGCKVKIRGIVLPYQRIRLAVYNDLTDDLIEKALKKLQYVLQQMNQQTTSWG